jgi:nucleotide-binding universal stress UspA family protein
MNLAFKTILVATDFSPASALALQYARTLATTFGASLHVLHVVQEPFPIGAEVYAPQLPQFRDELVDQAWRELSESVKAVSGVAVTPEVRLGQPSQQITLVAEEIAADLILMGTHGRGRVGNFIVGSVAERVVHAAVCPVMMVRDTAVPRAVEVESAAVASLVYK